MKLVITHQLVSLKQTEKDFCKDSHTINTLNIKIVLSKPLNEINEGIVYYLLISTLNQLTFKLDLINVSKGISLLFLST